MKNKLLISSILFMIVLSLNICALDFAEVYKEGWNTFPWEPWAGTATTVQTTDNMIGGPHSILEQNYYVPTSRNDCGVRFYSWNDLVTPTTKDWSYGNNLVWCEKVIKYSGTFNPAGGLMITVRGGRVVGVPYGTFNTTNQSTCAVLSLRNDFGLNDSELTHIGYVKSQHSCNNFTGDYYVDAMVLSCNNTQCSINQCGQITNDCGLNLNCGNCQVGYECQNNQCILSCQDECQFNQIQCTDNKNFLSCGNYDSDVCLEWSSSVSSCQKGFKCYNNQCIKNCKDKCRLGDKTCKNSEKIQTCADYNNDGCTEWGNVTKCDKYYKCINNECRLR